MPSASAESSRNIDVCFIHGHNSDAAAIGPHGIDELGEVGVAAAIIDANSRATSWRIREQAVRFHDLLAWGGIRP